jgi:CubicO group peptidase (beta-lactamase class C family)
MSGALCVALVACSASAARLQRVTSYVQAAIDQGQYAGAVTLIARDGQVVHWQALGYRDAARSDAMRPDAIFQIYSMTKPIASVAALLLLEEGKLSLEDPVSRYLPEFARMQVLEGNADSPRARPAARPITIQHLLTHTAGFAAGETLRGPAVERLNAARLDESPSLAAHAASIAALPLANDPGTHHSYDGVNTEVLSRVIEVVAEAPFDEFLAERVFAPLRMIDTGFAVPPDKRKRIVEMTSTDATGRLVIASADVNPMGEMLKRYPSGAGGLYSTAGDYLRFCQMLLNGGELEGAVVLGRKTVELLMANHPSQPGSVGQFGWSGAAATWFTIDPNEKLIAILMMQHLPRGLARDPPRLGQPFKNLVYRALVN